ncbi:hypothetical protein QYM36_007329 [Artemia franciscana]|uniref:Damage-specific DNA-binding protein 2 n=1 Tax=Artemia franciscana TaxID=6661 RepID=A0AA88LD64_ARTSF|nr:hypothetical protein QYM36_007329 [Artemia franciscana]
MTRNRSSKRCDNEDSNNESPADKPKSKRIKISEAAKKVVPVPAKKPTVNVLRTLSDLSFQGWSPGRFSHGHKNLKLAAMNHVNKLRVVKGYRPFDRRITFMTWHPKKPTVLAVGSKGGDIIFWDYNEPKHEHMINGQGPGGSIQAMKFDVVDPSKIYTASITGLVCKQDFYGRNTQVFLETDNKEEPWLISTASIDHTVKLWDIRNVKPKPEALHILNHNKPVNSAYFSLAHGNRLLTTDQHSELRIYEGPLWNHARTIAHPHRQFQHLTPIKAYWHPLEDIVIAGRYPDPNFPGYTTAELRTIDFFDADTGKILTQIIPHFKNGIISLNRFDAIGNVMVSGMGWDILVWKPFYPDGQDEKEDDEPTKFKEAETPEHFIKKKRGGGKTKKID